MALPLRYRVSLLIVLAAVLCAAGFFAFARPEYHPRYESKMIDFSQQHHYSSQLVGRTFAAHGIRLYAADGPVPGSAWLSNTRAPWPADALQVMVGPRTGKGSWGPKLEPYDERFGNVLVTYGGRDRRLLDQVKAAVSDLR